MDRATCVLLVLLCSSGCLSAADDDARQLTNVEAPDGTHNPSYEDVPEFEPDSACESLDLQAVYDATDRSVHELVTCGGMQVRLAQSMVGLLLLSNDRMFDEKTRQDIETYGDFLPRNEFELLDKGVWRLPMGPDSTFDVQMLDPRSREVLTHDVFDMETYLVGLEATYELTFEEMLENPAVRNHWVFSWDRPGPLIHLLNDGNPVPREFVLQLSLNEIISIIYPGWGGDAEPDLGPFESLFAIEMTSDIDLYDTRPTRAGSAVVAYDVHVPAQAIGEISSRAGLEFRVDSLEASVRDRTLKATRADIEYDGHVGRLQGLIEMQSEDDRVVLDFADGLAYPEPIWECGP